MEVGIRRQKRWRADPVAALGDPPAAVRRESELYRSVHRDRREV